MSCADLLGKDFPDTPVSSTNKTDRRDITEILLKVALNILTLNPFWHLYCLSSFFYLRILITSFGIFKLFFIHIEWLMINTFIKIRRLLSIIISTWNVVCVVYTYAVQQVERSLPGCLLQFVISHIDNYVLSLYVLFLFACFFASELYYAFTRIISVKAVESPLQRK